jgi:hypothetical protein
LRSRSSKSQASATTSSGSATPNQPRPKHLRRTYGECVTLVPPWRSGHAPSASGTAPGIRHSVTVVAESVYKAAALGVAALKSGGWADVVALGTELEIQVTQPETSHWITVQQVHRWCDGVTVSPEETLKKRRLKQLLA